MARVNAEIIEAVARGKGINLKDHIWGRNLRAGRRLLRKEGPKAVEVTKTGRVPKSPIQSKKASLDNFKK